MPGKNSYNKKMMSWIYSLFGFVVAIGILVTIHEYGHFKVARMLGVRVLKFSIGFGKPILKWRRKNDPTEYCIGAIPLGGYVKMLDEGEGEVAADAREFAFNRKSLAARTAIVAAGPVMNFIFAIIAIWLVFVVGNDDLDSKIGVVAENSVAARAGFKSGDRIIAVSGRENKTWGQNQFYLLNQAMRSEVVEFMVERDGLRRELQVDLDAVNTYSLGSRNLYSQLGLAPPSPPAQVWRFGEVSAARAAGLQLGDVIKSVDGIAVADWGELVRAVRMRPNKQIALTVSRGGQILPMQLTTASFNYNGREIGQIGLYRPPFMQTKLRYGWLAALPAAVEYNWYLGVVTAKSLGRMLIAKMSPENLSGPITIARIAGYTVETGSLDFLRFLAIISLSLGFINILPIPMLDGGHLLYFAIEAVRGKPLSKKAQLIGLRIGIIMLAGLMTLAFYNDIIRWFLN